MRRALAINEASFGKDHPDIAKNLGNLAHLLQATNRLSEAEPLMRRALAINEASFGKDHPAVAISLNNIALLLKATDRLSEAEPLMQRMVSILVSFTVKTGHPHPQLKIVVYNYASLLIKMGETEAKMREKIKGIIKPIAHLVK